MSEVAFAEAPVEGAARIEDAISLVHGVVKEVDWIRSLSARLARGGQREDLVDRDLAAIRELSSAAAREMHGFLRRVRGEWSPRSIRVGELIGRGVARVMLRDPSQVIVVQVAEEVRPVEVPAELQMAFLGVLENAVDFGGGRKVRLCARSGEGSLKIRVVDAGVGMAPRVLAACRNRGFTTRAETGGHGIGLHAAEQVLASLGGRLEVSSCEGVGTRVTLLIPIGTSGRGRG